MTRYVKRCKERLKDMGKVVRINAHAAIADADLYSRGQGSGVRGQGRTGLTPSLGGEAVSGQTDRSLIRGELDGVEEKVLDAVTNLGGLDIECAQVGI